MSLAYSLDPPVVLLSTNLGEGGLGGSDTGRGRAQPENTSQIHSHRFIWP